MSNCIICQRIPHKIVFAFAHKAFSKHLDKMTIHKIAVSACDIINYVDTTKRMFFCSKKQSTVLSGLFYILSKENGLEFTEMDFAISASIVTVRNSYKQWLNTFPYLFAAHKSRDSLGKEYVYVKSHTPRCIGWYLENDNECSICLDSGICKRIASPKEVIANVNIL